MTLFYLSGYCSPYKIGSVLTNRIDSLSSRARDKREYSMIIEGVFFLYFY